MVNYVDTNYLIRFFTQDHKTLSAKAIKFLKFNKNIFITAVVIAESMYIIRKHYKIPEQQIYNSFLGLVKQKNINVENYIPLAITIHRNESVGIYDCLIIAEATENKGQLHTFDKKMQRVFNKYSH